MKLRGLRDRSADPARLKEARTARLELMKKWGNDSPRGRLLRPPRLLAFLDILFLW